MLDIIEILSFNFSNIYICVCVCVCVFNLIAEIKMLYIA